MSSYKKGAAEAAAAHLAANVAEHTSGTLGTPIARGTAAARELEFKNRRSEYDSEIANLERMRNARGSLQAKYDGYCRVYARLERLASTLVNEFGVKGLQIPVFDPPALTGSVKMRTVEPSASAAALVTRPDGTKATVDTAQAYRETGGKGPSGKGLPTAAPVPGSAADGNWMEGAK